MTQESQGHQESSTPNAPGDGTGRIGIGRSVPG